MIANIQLKVTKNEVTSKATLEVKQREKYSFGVAAEGCFGHD